MGAPAPLGRDAHRPPPRAPPRPLLRARRVERGLPMRLRAAERGAAHGRRGAVLRAAPALRLLRPRRDARRRRGRARGAACHREAGRAARDRGRPRQPRPRTAAQRAAPAARAPAAARRRRPRHARRPAQPPGQPQGLALHPRAQELPGRVLS
eukprot:scaffold27307_cov63-Phaeocystis_antarctica.AAC.2